MLNSEDKLVSIVCRTYNSERYIAKAIQSVLCQTYHNWELIIVDDCSTDNTCGIVKQYKDERIKLYKNDINIGIIANLNKAISLCNGEYISILDGDDSYFPDKLEKQVDFLNSNPDYGAVFSYVELVYDKKYENTKRIFECLLNNPSGSRAEMLRKIFVEDNFLAFPTEMFRKELSINFPESIIGTGDCNFHIEILFKAKIKVLEMPLVKYTINGDANTSTWVNDNIISAEKIYLLQHFSEMQDIKLFKEVFKGKYEKFGNPTEVRDIPYFIARIAMELPRRFFSGFYLLQTIFLDNDYFMYIRKKFSLSYKEYISLRRFEPPVATVKKKILGICYYRAKRYENRIVKTFLYVFKKVIYSQTIDFYFANIKLFTICNKVDNVK